MRLVVVAFIALWFCGCAVMDTSILDTAEPLKPGHVKVETFVASGLVLESAVYNEDDYNSDDDDLEHAPQDATFMADEGINFGVGINDKAEVGGKVWVSFFSQGAKAYIKYNLDQNDDTYYSIMPAFTYAGNEYEENNNDHTDLHDHLKYKSIGLEIPLLVTQKVSENVSFTGAVRANFNHLEYEVDTGEEIIQRGPYTVVHGGFSGNLRVKLLWFIFNPELGVEVVPVIGGNLTVSPTCGLSVGLQF